MVLSVRVQPGAKRFAFTGVRGEQLKIAVPAPPVDGKANKALVRGLAALLGVRRSAVSLVSGHGSRDKRVRIDGDAATLSVAVAELIAAL